MGADGPKPADQLAELLARKQTFAARDGRMTALLLLWAVGYDTALRPARHRAECWTGFSRNDGPLAVMGEGRSTTLISSAPAPRTFGLRDVRIVLT
jgi:hypothetical protein